MQNKINKQEVWEALNEVLDPEVPVVTVVDLGIVRNVDVINEQLVVTITPTYSGCPATKVIEDSIVEKLKATGYQNFVVNTVLSPAWTTDWLSEAGKQKLKDYGIAPPVGSSTNKSTLFAEPKKVPCPQCNSVNTVMYSEFGSTPCKSLFKCNDCLEPFDYFKCH